MTDIFNIKASLKKIYSQFLKNLLLYYQIILCEIQQSKVDFNFYIYLKF